MRQKKSSVLFMAVIFFWFAQYVYIPFQTPYLTSVKTGADFIGIIVGAYGISQMALRLPVGVFAERSSRKPPVRSCWQTIWGFWRHL